MKLFALVGFLGLGLACTGADKQVSVKAAESTAPVPSLNLDPIYEMAREQAKAWKIPGLAIGLVHDGQLIGVKGFGTSSLARDINENTVFRLGSITKVFTAAAILRLRDDGKLNLFDPVANYIPELAGTLSPKGREPVRIVHLLQHTSGIPTLGDGTLDWTQGPPITEAQVIASVKDAQLAFRPGSKMAYSNVGVALAGIVVSRVSDTSYQSYVTSKLLAPLKMTATKWDRGDYDANMVFPGFVKTGDEYVESKDHWRMGATSAAGGLYSTAKDMARFLAFEANPSLAPSVLAKETVRLSQTRGTSPAGTPMGLGWVVETQPDLGTVVWHNGATYSYGAWLGLDLKRGNGIVLFASTGDLGIVTGLDPIGKDALRILAGLEPSHAQKSAPKGQDTDAKLIALVGKRLLELFNDPQEARYEDVFADEFLKEIPAENLRQMLITLRDQLGPCKSYELAKDSGTGQFELLLSFDKGDLIVAISADTAAPHRLHGLLIRPVVDLPVDLPTEP